MNRNDYICDDRDQLENAQNIKNMTDEEFELYISKIKNDE